MQFDSSNDIINDILFTRHHDVQMCNTLKVTFIHRLSQKKVSIKSFNSDLFIILSHSFLISSDSVDL